jgi:hypothetical protein
VLLSFLASESERSPAILCRQIADDWAKARGMLFMEASAKTKEGIAQVFNEVVQKVGERSC